MKPAIVAACAALVLSACGQSEAPEPEAPAAPQSLYDQVLRMPQEQQPVFAYQQLAAYQQANPDGPRCSAVRATEPRGVIPENIHPDSIYAPHVGSLVFSVQCGELRSMTAYDPTQHWLVVFAPDAAEPTFVYCADARGRDQCPVRIPLVEAASP